MCQKKQKHVKQKKLVKQKKHIKENIKKYEYFFVKYNDLLYVKDKKGKTPLRILKEWHPDEHDKLCKRLKKLIKTTIPQINNNYLIKN